MSPDPPSSRKKEPQPGLTVLHPGDPPPCLTAGVLLCRACPGWLAMKKALFDPHSGWTKIHCAATGLILSRKEDG